MATMLTGSYPKLLDPVVKAAYLDKFDGWEEIYSKIAFVETLNEPYDEEAVMGGLSGAVEKGEGEAFSFASPGYGWEKRFTPVSYGLGFRVSLEMQQDDRLKVVQRIAGQLGRSMRLTPETLTSNIYNRAFTAAYTGPDGKVLCATDHPYVKGDTFANRPTAASVLSVLTLKAALTYFATMKTHSGTPALITPKYLMVHPANWFTALEILQSVGMPYSMDNTKNVIKDCLVPIKNRFLTSETAWFVIGEPDGESGVKFKWRLRPSKSPHQYVDEATGDICYRNFMRCVPGWVDPLNVYGNPGA